MLTALAYPLCMLTIQLPSRPPTGPPPTILVLLWMKQATDESSAGGKHTGGFSPNLGRRTRATVNGDKLSTGVATQEALRLRNEPPVASS